jgi:hypothetical protein
MNTRSILAACATAAVLQLANPGSAIAAEGWDVRLTPYLWAFGIDGDIQARGDDYNVSTDFADIVDNLDLGGSALLEFNNGNWVNLLQLDYMGLDNGGADIRNTGREADIEFESTMLAAVTGYRVMMSERSIIDVMVGVRYAKLDVQLDVPGVGQRDSDNAQYDGILMLRPRLALGQNWHFSPTLSVGAGDSELTWELSPQFTYTYCDTEIRFGYRNLNYDVENGDSQVDLSIRGPMVGIGFKF